MKLLEKFESVARQRRLADNTFDAYRVLYTGDGTPTLVDVNLVQIPLLNVGPFGGDTTVLNASADTQIVAADDGGTWDGATDLVLPFP